MTLDYLIDLIYFDFNVPEYAKLHIHAILNLIRYPNEYQYINIRNFYPHLPLYTIIYKTNEYLNYRINCDKKFSHIENYIYNVLILDIVKNIINNKIFLSKTMYLNEGELFLNSLDNITGKISTKISKKLKLRFLNYYRTYIYQYNNIMISDTGSLGLNIEGHRPYLLLDGAKWVNLVMVLDNPVFSDNFDELIRIKEENNFPIIENVKSDIDEFKIFAVMIMIIKYYARNHKKVIVHVHQFPENAIQFIDFFKTIIDEPVIYFFDTPTFMDTMIDYGDCDVLISLSQCAGLSKNFSAGTLIIPEEFIETQIINDELYISERRHIVKNDLTYTIGEIIRSDLNEECCKIVSTKYVSANPQKNKTIDIVELEDFHEGKILVVDKIWSPKTKNLKYKTLNCLKTFNIG